MISKDKYVIVQVLLDSEKYLGLFGLGSTKLALIFSRIGEKPARLHISIFKAAIFVYCVWSICHRNRVCKFSF